MKTTNSKNKEYTEKNNLCISGSDSAHSDDTLIVGDGFDYAHSMNTDRIFVNTPPIVGGTRNNGV
jgi:hypothetical protein